MYEYSGNATHVVQMSVAKISTQKGLTKAYGHNNRIGEKQANNIDMRREELNEILLDNCVSGNYMIDIVNKVTGSKYTPDDIKSIDKNNLFYTDGKKLRSDAVLAGECKSGYPGDLKWVMFDENGSIKDVPTNETPDPEKGHFQYPADMEEFREWQAKTVEFLQERFGKDNVLQVQCHMDEAVPHIHAIFSPTYKDDRNVTKLAYSHYICGPKELAQLQTEYANALADMGYNRGREWSSNKGHVNGMTATKVRALMQRSFDEVPTPTKEDIVKDAIESHDWHKKNEVLQKMADNEKEIYDYSQKVAVERTMAGVHSQQVETDGNLLSKVRQENDKLKQRVRELESAAEEQEKDFQQKILSMQLSLKKEECRKKGMENYSDRTLVADIEQLNDIWTKEGLAWYAEHGIDMSYDDKEPEKE